MATLIHLNGPPGVGKSTIAERYVAEHPGVLNADVDRLRCLVGGWRDDFGGTGEVIRPVALAMIRAHLDGGRDVVLPQMLVSEIEQARFRSVAVDGGHAYVHMLLQAPPGEARARFYGRRDDALNGAIREVVDADGGGPVIEDLARALSESAVADPDAISVYAGDSPGRTYDRLLADLEARTRPL